MKKYVVLLILLLVGIAFARINYNPSSNAEGLSDGFALMSSQVPWQTFDETVSGATATDLGVTERTYITVLAAIALAAGNDDEISYSRIPPTWNAVKFRCIGATEGGVITYQIYLGTLGGGTDCELVKAGQLAFVIGQQASITSGFELADAVTVTQYCWTKTWGSTSPGSELVATAELDVQGADIMFAVPTAANCNAKLLVKGS